MSFPIPTFLFACFFILGCSITCGNLWHNLGVNNQNIFDRYYLIIKDTSPGVQKPHVDKDKDEVKEGGCEDDAWENPGEKD